MTIRVLLSGGLDSAVVLGWAVANFDDVSCIAFRYGQRHEREVESARRIARLFDLGIIVKELRFAYEGALLSGEYVDLASRNVVIPNRNERFLCMAATTGPVPAAVAFGASLADREVFEDCRPEFVARMSDDLGMPVHAPLLSMGKARIVRLARAVGGDLLLRHTWSCYAGAVVACGKCGACLARLDGFYFAQLDDPIEYAPGTERDTNRRNYPERYR